MHQRKFGVLTVSGHNISNIYSDLIGFYSELFKRTTILDNTTLYTGYGLRNV